MSKWLRFEELEPKPGCKTSLCIVHAKLNGETLGIIKWFPEWRQYSFWPIGETIYAGSCLNDIAEQIKKMEKEREKKWQSGK